MGWPAFQAAQAASTPDALGKLLIEARAQKDWVLSIQRQLHQWPELMYEVHNTSATIRKHLDELGINYKFPAAKTGVVATIGKGNPVVALRADIDALPITEETDLPHSSKVPGKMHACGHDGHTAMLLGAAKLLKQHEQELQGSVKLLFQPAEEGGAGGKRLVKEGHLKGVKGVFGFHLWPTLPTGTIHTKKGTIMASACQFDLTIKGRGGHAAMPHNNIDPVVAGAAIVTALQTLVSRETSPLDSAVISIPRFNAGEAYNVIPDTVSLGGTLRTLTHEASVRLRKRMEEVIKNTAAALGCLTELDWMQNSQPYYPPVVNDAKLTQFVEDLDRLPFGCRVTGAAVQEAEPSMAGESSTLTVVIPSVFSWIGMGSSKKGTTSGLHTPKLKIDDDALPLGVAMHTALAFEYLNQRAGAGSFKSEL
eukprot:jgi/Astpho2/3084/e_gw1.00051.95.1_t